MHKITGKGKEYSRSLNSAPSDKDSTPLTLEETEEELEDPSSIPEPNPAHINSLPTPISQKSSSESVRVKKGILKTRDVIGYKVHDQNKYVEVIGRAGKASGKHSSFWNVRNVETGEKFSVNVKDLQVEHVGTLEGELDNAIIVGSNNGKRTKINGSLLEVEFPLRENGPVQLEDMAEDAGIPEQDQVEGPRDKAPGEESEPAQQGDSGHRQTQVGEGQAQEPGPLHQHEGGPQVEGSKDPTANTEHSHDEPEESATYAVNIPRSRHYEPQVVHAKRSELHKFKSFGAFSVVSQI